MTPNQEEALERLFYWLDNRYLTDAERRTRHLAFERDKAIFKALIRDILEEKPVDQA